jgi:predicted dehydrogenase
MSQLRAGVVGLGMMGRHHVRVLHQLEEVELVGAVDPEGDRHGAATAAGVPVYDSVDLLIEQGLDFCVVVVPTAEHLRVALRLADARIATLVEKPVAGTSAEATAVLDAFAAKETIAAVGHIERFNPALIAMRSRLLGGELGEIYQIATRRQGPFPDRISDVGVVKDLATHDVDLTSWLADSRYADVAAQVAHRAGRQHEDLVAVVGRLESGVVVSHLVNWLTPTKERVVVVTGERGCFVADMLNADLTYYANGSIASEWDAISRFRGVAEGDMIRYAIPKPEPLRSELEAFVAAVRTGDPGLTVSLSDGIEALLVAERITGAATSTGAG